MNVLIVSALVAVYVGGTREPTVALRFKDPAKCQVAADVYNEVLPKLLDLQGDLVAPKSSEVFDRVLRFVCVDGVVVRE